MTEQQPQHDSAEAGSVTAASETEMGLTSEPAMVESPAIAPDQELTSPKPDAVEPREVVKHLPKVEAPPKADVRAERTAEAPRPAGKVMIMPPRERAWSSAGQPEAAAPPRRRLAAMAAVVALAAIAGAIGGALATGNLGGNAGGTVVAHGAGVEAAIARIDADVLALKASVEQNARLGVTQFNKTSDRLEKVEKAQAEPTARLARLSDEVGKLRAAQAAAPVAAAPAQLAAAPPALTTVPKDVTGSVAPPAVAAAPQAPGAAAKVEVGRLPTVEGWVLREVGRGSALIESRRGLFEVFAGDPIPGLGRVDAIRKQDGRWVVVTSKGLIVSR